MADWYCSSVTYAAVAVFVTGNAYVVGDLVRPTAPATNAQYVYRCTTAGTSAAEPNWITASTNNQTVTSGGVTFTNVTGQPTYNWSAAAGTLSCYLQAPTGVSRLAAGDRIFVSQDHAETTSTNMAMGSGTTNGMAGGYGVLQIICVNRAGSVPPAAGDVTTGAVVTTSGGPIFFSRIQVYHQGIAYVLTGSSQVQFGDGGASGNNGLYYKNCSFTANPNAFTPLYVLSTCTLTLDNTPIGFGASTQAFYFSGTGNTFNWINTPNAITGTAPNILFGDGSNSTTCAVTFRGVDLSAVTGTLITYGSPAQQVRGNCNYLFDQCRIAPSLTRYNSTFVTNSQDIAEFVNCYNGTKVINESYQPSGAVTTEFAITLSGGATDNVGGYAHKMTSNANIDKFVQPLCGFWIDCNYSKTGTVRTATMEIISSTSLNSDEISLWVEYQGAIGSSLASFVTSLTPATSAAVTTSTATWMSLPATPVKQKLQVTFVPQTVGRVRAQVRLGKANTTCYYNPQVTIT